MLKICEGDASHIPTAYSLKFQIFCELPNVITSRKGVKKKRCVHIGVSIEALSLQELHLHISLLDSSTFECEAEKLSAPRIQL